MFDINKCKKECSNNCLPPVFGSDIKCCFDCPFFFELCLERKELCKVIRNYINNDILRKIEVIGFWKGRVKG